MQRKEIFKKLEKDLKPRVEYNYKKTTRGVSIMKKINKATEKEMLKELVKGFTKLGTRDKLENRFDKLENRFDKFEKANNSFNSQVFEFMKRQDEFNKAIMQRLDNVEDKIDYVSHRLDNIVSKNHLSE